MIKQSYKTIIIGGGVAGLAAGITTKGDTLLVEKNRLIGKKLLLTGQGMCNFTNNLPASAFIKKCHKYGNFLKKAYYNFDNQDFIKLLQDNKCPVSIREDGKAFPESGKSVSVRDTLLQMARDNGTEIVTRMSVNNIYKKQGGFELELADLSGIKITFLYIQAEKVIISAGGCSYPQTGSDGSGYILADRLGHAIEAIHPALASIDIAGYDVFRNCAGNTLSGVPVTFITKEGKKKSKGDLLFTHTGLSGPVILDNSYLLSPKDKVRISIIEKGTEKVRMLREEHPKRNVRTLLKLTDISQAIIDAILDHLKIDKNKQAAHLTKSEINGLGSFLENAEFTVKSLQDVKQAMATAGGVDIKQVNPATMESLLVKGLYFAGDVLSYTLPSGGYSIQAAFSTGRLAGEVCSG